MVPQALHEHGPTQATKDHCLIRSATSPKTNVRKILDTTPSPLNPGDDLHRAPRFVTNVAINCETSCETCALKGRRTRRGSPDAYALTVSTDFVMEALGLKMI